MVKEWKRGIVVLPSHGLVIPKWVTSMANAADVGVHMIIMEGQESYTEIHRRPGAGLE